MPMERRLRKSDFTRWFSSEGKSILYPHPSIPVLHHTYTFPSTSSPTFLYYGQELSIGHDGAQGFQERGVDGLMMGIVSVQSDIPNYQAMLIVNS